jgi:hypothetical protein
MLKKSVAMDPFDTSNFQKQMTHFMSTKTPDVSVPDDLVEPAYDRPNPIQINVVDASKWVGTENEFVDAMEQSNKTLWLGEVATKGKLPDAPRDEETKEFEANWYPNELDNLENLPQLAESFISKSGVIDKKDRYGDIFAENYDDIIDYVNLKASENERVLDQMYATI